MGDRWLCRLNKTIWFSSSWYDIYLYLGYIRSKIRNQINSDQYVLEVGASIF